MSRSIVLSLAAGMLLLAGLSTHAQDAIRPYTDHAHAGAAQGHSVLRPDDRNCLRSTGSLIPPKPGECLPVAGRSYDREDIRRTGARTTAEALQMLDPSLTVRGH
jgi:hypothetical protein